MNERISPLRAQLAAGFSARDVMQQCLQRVAEANPRLNAVITVNPKALQDADQADAAAVRGKLQGLPITVKDAFATAGLRTTSAYKPLADYIPDADADLLIRARKEGAVLLGKTNLPELAGDIQCDNRLFGRTNNPFDLARTSGGSSGGGAVAVASAMSVMDIGSDLGGSIRIPAAFCGVAGLKVTEGRWPVSGHIPPLPGQMRTVRHMLSPGLLARYVDDLRLGFAALDTAAEAAPAVPEKLRIAWYDDFGGIPLCSRTRAGLHEAVEKLAAQGHETVRAKPADFEMHAVWQAYGAILGVEMGLGLPAVLRYVLRMGRFFLPAQAGLTRAFSRGLVFHMRDYHRALNERMRLIAALEDFLAGYDAWLCPVCPTVAFAHTPFRLRLPSLAIDTKRLPYLEASVSLAVPFSLTGSPVITLPAGLQQGLPVGLQLVGRRHEDARLLAVASRVEAAWQGFVEPPGFSYEW